MQIAKRIVCSLMKVPCDYRITASIKTAEYFDFFVYPINRFAIYAYNYDLDSPGLALLEVDNQRSFLWPFEGKYEYVENCETYYAEMMELALSNEKCFWVSEEGVDIVYEAESRSKHAESLYNLDDLIRIYEDKNRSTQRDT